MIIGTGIDIIDVGRIKKSMTRFPGMEKKLFTTEEINYCRSKRNLYHHFSARFAAKEAMGKALGKGIKGITWKDISVQRSRNGKPEIKLFNNAANLAIKMGVRKMHLSLSFTDTLATAMVVLED